MKKTLGIVCGVLFAIVVGLSLRGGPQRKTETLVQPSTQSPSAEQSEPAPVVVASVPEPEVPAPEPVAIADVTQNPVSETPTPVIVELKLRSLTRVTQPPINIGSSKP